MEMPSDRVAKTRVGIAFFFLFVFMIVCSVGARFVVGLGTPPASMAARGSPTASQGIAEPAEIDRALSQKPSNDQKPSNKLSQMMAMATGAANETSSAIEKLLSEVEPPAISNAGNLGAANRSDLEALRRDLKTAEANAATSLPLHIAVLKAERDAVENYALSLHPGKDTISRLLDDVDRRHTAIAAFIARLLAARADLYRAYGNYVAFLIREFGTYKVVQGEFIFPFQHTVDSYNVAAHAMTVAAKRVGELEEERKTLMQAQQQAWEQFVNGR
jgi:hypothetical protein